MFKKRKQAKIEKIKRAVEENARFWALYYSEGIRRKYKEDYKKYGVDKKDFYKQIIDELNNILTTYWKSKRF